MTIRNKIQNLPEPVELSLATFAVSGAVVAPLIMAVAALDGHSILTILLLGPVTTVLFTLSGLYVGLVVLIADRLLLNP